MTSIKNIVTIAAVLGGAAAFVSLGGASGIGSKIGGAFKGFGDSFISGLGIPSLGGATPEANVVNATEALTGKTPPVGPALALDSLTKTKGLLDDFNNFISNVVSGSQFNAGAFSTAKSFTPLAITSRMARTETNKFSAPFGGFGDPVTQENALQAAIIASKGNNPQWFR